jgi:hypothetical protein
MSEFAYPLAGLAVVVHYITMQFGGLYFEEIVVVTVQHLRTNPGVSKP